MSYKKMDLEFEYNITSVIDFLTVLITYLLAAASTISIAAFDAGVAGASHYVLDSPVVPIQIQVTLQEGNNILIKTSGKESRVFHVNAQDGKWNFQGLQQQLTEIKQKWPTVDSVAINSGKEIEYQSLILGIEAAHKVMPQAFLGEQGG